MKIDDTLYDLTLILPVSKYRDIRQWGQWSYKRKTAVFKEIYLANCQPTNKYLSSQHQKRNFGVWRHENILHTVDLSQPAL